MTTTYDIETSPIEGGVQQVYQEVRESLRLILTWNFQRDHHTVEMSLRELDDAVSNNWDELMASFWRGVAEQAEANAVADG